jgi:hypothetical protein
MAKSFTQVVADFLTFSNDSNATTFAKSLVNTGIHYILSLQDWNFNKDSITYASVASQQDYDKPMPSDKIRYVNVYSGSIWYAE